MTVNETHNKGENKSKKSGKWVDTLGKADNLPCVHEETAHGKDRHEDLEENRVRVKESPATKLFYSGQTQRSPAGPDPYHDTKVQPGLPAPGLFQRRGGGDAGGVILGFSAGIVLCVCLLFCCCCVLPGVFGLVWYLTHKD